MGGRRAHGVARLACSLRVRRGRDRGVPVPRRRGRGPVAFTNVLVDKLLALPLALDAAADPFPAELCHLANERMPCKAAGFEGLGLPVERFIADLARLGIGART